MTSGEQYRPPVCIQKIPLGVILCGEKLPLNHRKRLALFPRCIVFFSRLQKIVFGAFTRKKLLLCLLKITLCRREGKCLLLDILLLFVGQRARKRLQIGAHIRPVILHCHVEHSHIGARSQRYDFDDQRCRDQP